MNSSDERQDDRREGGRVAPVGASNRSATAVGAARPRVPRRPMRRALILVPLLVLAGLLAGCQEQPTSTNPAVTPLAPVSRCTFTGGAPVGGCGEPGGPSIYSPISYPSTTTRSTVPYPPTRRY